VEAAQLGEAAEPATYVSIYIFAPNQREST
jgi:hypothetical protein